MKTEPNELAFPAHIKGRMIEIEAGGLTKLEYFSALAMQGLLANSTFEVVPEKIAEKSVALAEGLIKELNKTQ